jgi:5-methylcytosine-specific restriction endonuclease McrA
MTPAAKAKLRIKKQAQRERLKKRIAARKAKRAVKAAPRKALAQWSLAVRACGCCVVCGATAHLNAHHLLPKERYPEFKLLTINGVPLCPGCHKFSKYSAHRNPIWFTLWLRANRREQYQWAKQHMGSP